MCCDCYTQLQNILFGSPESLKVFLQLGYWNIDLASNLTLPHPFLGSNLVRDPEQRLQAAPSPWGGDKERLPKEM